MAKRNKRLLSTYTTSEIFKYMERNKVSTENRYIKRIDTYSITEVFEYIDASPTKGQKVDFHGHKLYLRKTRLLNFRKNGIVCANCKSKGAFFALEKYKGNCSPHFNLYGFCNTGDQILFTRDHIKPKFLGGTNHLYNSQTMCTKCNRIKGHSWPLKARVKYMFNRFRYFIGRVA